ncbi:MAG: energy-coupling factor ABC transporter permease [Chlorobium sp.]|uniref:energy-coupling factor ABC transporter permease n=1 Tax=Chlorobium sp. TaxID=1095 RepID=UPI0025B946F0|nr:energy-coupling factor ABC transporter permease [Chlorobium sp.]MCF8216452.1 energy-coupling factor ABC transporter permease [Chlorobium sp.]MCF8271382.1 energy-coupling factor ABC transporter permease [Chlorobium sp.]MCF8287729.1 energy-coupling factor ABC transporter permease [Chlorobium sp.]MCF8291293.1 energy-coupling factor ABC transporter permease [Chlorobium sp.]MCF8385388.1 energy-coupling factor ABC transporter permease [Chlorobium sp.]
MHMSDALLSPAVGGTFWAISGGLIAWSVKKTALDQDGRKTALMGVLGAFVFAAQMINFTIPGTGSSGHLGGGLLLTVLLGPWRAFIALASVLVIQCLFFADGGVLALGCNIFNLAFFPAFVAYPFLYRTIAGNPLSSGRLGPASVIAATAGLLMGACSVVIQTTASGISALPFGTFLLFMLPIHLAIGIVEGLVTWAVVAFTAKAEPSILDMQHDSGKRSALVPAVFVLVALLTGGVLSWFASSYPDGLEWSMAKTSGMEELEGRDAPLHSKLSSIQEKLAFLPDYGFRPSAETAGSQEISATENPVNPGTSISGIAGSIMVLILAGAAGMLIRSSVHRTENAGE